MGIDNDVGGVAIESTRLLDDLNILLGVLADSPELNPSNYDHENVCRLNTAMIEAWSICKGVVDRLSSNAANQDSNEVR